MDSKNHNLNISDLPIDLRVRFELALSYELGAVELMRLEYMFNRDRSSLSLTRELLGDKWHKMTASLVKRQFLVWGDKKRLELTSKSICIIAVVEQPIWKN